MMKNHPYHMVTKSPWSILTSINTLTMLMGSITLINNKEILNLYMGMLLTITCSMLWWNDLTRESTFQGNHTKEVTKMMKYGMIMFISSETLLFSSLFWTFFHSSLT